jgi:hypothetical protein
MRDDAVTVGVAGFFLFMIVAAIVAGCGDHYRTQNWVLRPDTVTVHDTIYVKPPCHRRK